MSELLKNVAITPARRLLPAMDGPAAMAQSTATLSRQKELLAQTFATELEELREEARSDGYLTGYESGKTDAEAHVATQRTQLEQQFLDAQTAVTKEAEQLAELFDNMSAGYRVALADLEPAAVSIAFEAITRLLGSAEHYSSALPVLVKNAIEQFGMEQALRIHISETDRELLLAAPELAAWHGLLQIDKQLPPASCVVEAGPRSLDASLLQQLDAIRQCLLVTCTNRGPSSV